MEDCTMTTTVEETKEQKRMRLKKLLREKINRSSNNNSTMRQALMKDPQTALLSLGVDDKLVLDNAKNIVNSAKKIANKNNVSLPASTTASLQDTSETASFQYSQPKTAWAETDTDDEELPELPPCFKRELSKSENNSDGDEELPENI